VLRPPPNIDQSLVRAYERTHYCLPTLSAIVRVGAICPILEDWLRGEGLKGGVFITAYNPGSRLLPATENRCWQNTLETELRQWQQAYLPAIHRDPDEQWPDEPACFVFELKATAALALAKRYQQKAVLVYQLTGGAALWWCT
jgi:hypothetical protein